MDRPGLHRRGKTDIRDKNICIGSSFKLWTEPVTESYRIGLHLVEKGTGPRIIHDFRIINIEPASSRKHLIAKSLTHNSIDPELKHSLVIDVTLNEDGFVDTGQRFVGILGKPEDVEVKPFVVEPDGNLDFDANFIFAEVEFRNVEIKTGELFFVRSGSQRYAYRIDEVV
jgi:hypothetical protein